MVMMMMMMMTKILKWITGYRIRPVFIYVKLSHNIIRSDVFTFRLASSSPRESHSNDMHAFAIPIHNNYSTKTWWVPRQSLADTFRNFLRDGNLEGLRSSRQIV